MKTFKLVDYKGKFDIIMDEDMVDELDIVVGEIALDEAKLQAQYRKEEADYYGIPAYIGDDEELKIIYRF